MAWRELGCSVIGLCICVVCRMPTPGPFGINTLTVTVNMKSVWSLALPLLHPDSTCPLLALVVLAPVLLWAPKPGLASPPAWSQPLPGAPCSLPAGLLTECSRRILLLYTPPPSASSPALFLLLPAQASSSLVTRVPMTEHHHSLSWSFPGAQTSSLRRLGGLRALVGSFFLQSPTLLLPW